MSLTTLTGGGQHQQEPTGRGPAFYSRLALFLAVVAAAVTVMGGFTDFMSGFDRYGGWRAAALLGAFAFVALAVLLLFDRPRSFKTRPSRSRIIGACISVAMVGLLMSYFLLAATPLQRRWDGVLGWDLPGCTTPNSVEVRALPREVRGPGGTVVGYLELRTVNSRECPPAIWGRLMWSTDDGLYQIPPGWTLHMKVHRGDEVIDEPEPSRTMKVSYALSRVMIADQDCVTVEAYFFNDATGTTTPSANTTCMKA